MTLRALIAKAYEVAPSSPSHAFVAAGVRLRWIDPDFDGTMTELRQPSTPTDILPIIEAGGDLQHFGFLMRRGGFPFFSTATDRRSIVNVTKDDLAEPFANNLRSLLSVAATVGLLGVTRGDLEERETREAPQSEAFAEASINLLTIPGVRRVDDLTSLLDRRDLTFTYGGEQLPPYKPPVRPSILRYAGWALHDAEGCLEHGFAVEALGFCEDGFNLVEEGFLDNEHAPVPATSARHGMLKADLLRRIHLVRLKALSALGDPERNREALLEAVHAFATLPFVHAACWMELQGLMTSLGVVDLQVRTAIEAHARAAEAETETESL